MEPTDPTSSRLQAARAEEAESRETTSFRTDHLSLRIGILECNPVAVLTHQEPVQEITNTLLSSLRLGPGIALNRASIQKEAEALVRSWLGTGIDFSHLSSKDKTVINEIFLTHLSNRLSYFCEVVRHLREDLNSTDFREKFAFGSHDVAHVELAPFFADPHNGATGPVRLTLVMDAREEPIDIVYKPREMGLEAAICDTEVGLLNSFNVAERQRVSATGGIRQDPYQLATYPVLARPGEPSGYGYAGYVSGELVFDEEASVQADSIGSDWSVVSPSSPYPETFFTRCYYNELEHHILLFHVLTATQIGDQHAANFKILPPTSSESRDRKLVPIDIEVVTSDPVESAQDELNMATNVLRARYEVDSDERLNRLAQLIQPVQTFIAEFNDRIRHRFANRYIPLSTARFYEMRSLFLLALTQGPTPTKNYRAEYEADREYLKRTFEERHIILDDPTNFDRQLDEVFLRFDIPHFVIKDSIVYLGRDRIGQQE